MSERYVEGGPVQRFCRIGGGEDDGDGERTSVFKTWRSIFESLLSIERKLEITYAKFWGRG